MKKSKILRDLEADKPHHIITYGTSLTAEGAWVDHLRSELSNRYPRLSTITNSCKSGIWSKWGVDNLERRVIRKQPDTVMIEVCHQ